MQRTTGDALLIWQRHEGIEGLIQSRVERMGGTAGQVLAMGKRRRHAKQASSVLTVSEAGEMRGIAPGTATVTATPSVTTTGTGQRTAGTIAIIVVP